MLIDETRPLATATSDAWDSEMLERELNSGVMVEQAPLVYEHRVETLLGGLITAEEDVLAREVDLSKAPAGDVDLIE